MFIKFDYRCPDCGHQEERFVRRSEMDSQCCNRHAKKPEGQPEDCIGVIRTVMTRLPAGTRTTFRFADTKLKR